MNLRLDGVACARGGRLLFEGLDLSLGGGGAAVVTGPNGAGKSSLLRLCARLLRPVAGTVEAGRTALLGEQTALDGTAARVEEALAAVDLAALADVPVRLLSTGQRRRAGLARVVASGAALWLLDEPANGLDVASVARLEAIVADHRAGGGAVLVATHLPLELPDAAEVRLGMSA